MRRLTRGQVASKVSSAENFNHQNPNLINSREKIKASVIRQLSSGKKFNIAEAQKEAYEIHLEEKKLLSQASNRQVDVFDQPTPDNNVIPINQMHPIDEPHGETGMPMPHTSQDGRSD